jgi:hypothetical protein
VWRDVKRDELIWGEVGVRKRTMVKPTEALRAE